MEAVEKITDNALNHCIPLKIELLLQANRQNLQYITELSDTNPETSAQTA